MIICFKDANGSSIELLRSKISYIQKFYDHRGIISSIMIKLECGECFSLVEQEMIDFISQWSAKPNSYTADFSLGPK